MRFPASPSGVMTQHGGLIPRRSTIRGGTLLALILLCLPTIDSAGPARAAAVQYAFGGDIASLSPAHLALSTNLGTLHFMLQPSTTYLREEYAGSNLVRTVQGSRTELRVGRPVIVTARRAGNGLVATVVQDLRAYSHMKTIVGKVTSVNPGGMTVVSGKRNYVVTVAYLGVVTLDFRTVTLSSARVGEWVVAVGVVTGSTVRANGVAIYTVRPPPAARSPNRRAGTVPRGPNTTISGTLRQGGPGGLTLADRSGRTYRLALTTATKVVVNKSPLPATALPFLIGAPVTVRGVQTGQALVVSSLTANVNLTVITGRVESISGNTARLRLANGQVDRAQLPPGIRIVGSVGAGHVIPVGAFLQVAGVRAGPSVVRALVGRIVNPTLRIQGSAVSVDQGFTVRTDSAERYRVQFAPGLRLSIQGAKTAISPGSVPAGASVSIHGTVLTSGVLAADRGEVTLRYVSARGRVTSNTGSTMTIRVGSRTWNLRVNGDTVFRQGSMSLPKSDLATRDDVAFSGYAIRGGSVLATTVSVYRKQVTLDGSVQALTGDGFTLSAAGKTYRVVIGGAPGDHPVTVPTLGVGSAVHVVGYLRGDGVVLAWHIDLSGD